MANQWSLPDIILNPGGTLLDVAKAFPLGILSMWGYAPAGSKQDQVAAASRFVPVKITVPRPGTNLPPTTQTFNQFTTEWVNKSKTTTTEAKTFWSEDTIPEPFPGFDLLGEYGKYIPLIIIAIVIILVVPRLFGGKK